MTGKNNIRKDNIKKDNIRFKKWAVTVISGALLLLLYSLIFSFSAQNGEESGSLSAYVSEKCVELFNALTGRHWSQLVMQEMAVYFEHPVRKLAHFSEYAVMGVLVFGLWSQWLKGRGLYLLTVIWVFLSAAADEFHQYFIPGRYASFLDVLLDTCGGAFGMLCMLLLKRLIVGRKPKNHFFS